MGKLTRNGAQTAPQECSFCSDYFGQMEEMNRIRNKSDKPIKCYRRFYSMLRTETTEIGKGMVEVYIGKPKELNFCPVCGKCYLL